MANSPQGTAPPATLPTGPASYNENSIGVYTPLICEFHGDSTRDVGILSLLCQIDDIALMCSWPDIVCRWVLRSKLKSKAALFFEQKIETAPIRDYSEAKKLLVDKYAKHDYGDPWRQIFDCRCLIGETMDEYSTRLRLLQEKCNSESSSNEKSFIGEDKLLEIFLAGLPSAIQAHLIVITPNNFNEAVHWTKQIEGKLAKIAKPKQSAMMIVAQDAEESDSDTPFECSIAGLKITDDSHASNAGVAPIKDRGETHAKKDVVKTPNRNKAGKSDINREGPIAVAGSTRKVRDSTLKTSVDTKTTWMNKHMVTLRIRGREAKCLIDPASDISIVDDAVLASLGLNHKVRDVTPFELHSALATKTTLSKAIDLYFTFSKDKDQYIHTFHIMKGGEMLNYGIILGIDFLVANDAILDYGNNTLVMWGRVVTPLEHFTSKPTTLKVMDCYSISPYIPGANADKTRTHTGVGDHCLDTSSPSSTASVKSSSPSRMTHSNKKKTKQSPRVVHSIQLTEEEGIRAISPVQPDSREEIIVPVEGESIATAYTASSWPHDNVNLRNAGIGVHWGNGSIHDYSGLHSMSGSRDAADCEAMTHAIVLAYRNKIEKLCVISNNKFVINNMITNAPKWRIKGLSNARCEDIESVNEMVDLEDISDLVEVQWRYAPDMPLHPGT